MSPIKSLTNIIMIHSIWIILLIPVFSFCQNSDANVSDSIVAEPVNNLDLSEISRKSAEITLKTKTILQKVIKDKELERIDNENKKIIQTYDSNLYKERNLDFTL